ncbi:MAG: DUF6261 family protein [Dysgonamonadaceae bacterium]|jgi:hypothetical protein|nr:DUF6261 family protein [Dysgonamonadaceae bacterium]
MKINKVSITQMRNEEHFAYMLGTKSNIQDVSASTLGIEPLYSDFEICLTEEDAALEPASKSTLTDEISEADIRRDGIYRGLVLHIESGLYSPDPLTAKIDQTLKAILDRYGDVRSLPYEQEYATIVNLVQDLNMEASLSGLPDTALWVKNLSAANEEVESLLRRRWQQTGSKTHYDMLQVRKNTDAAYNKMIEYLNASFVVREVTDENIVRFVEAMNGMIAQFRQTLAVRRGHAKTSKPAGDKPE